MANSGIDRIVYVCGLPEGFVGHELVKIIDSVYPVEDIKPQAGDHVLDIIPHDKCGCFVVFATSLLASNAVLKLHNKSCFGKTVRVTKLTKEMISFLESIKSPYIAPPVVDNIQTANVNGEPEFDDSDMNTVDHGIETTGEKPAAEAGSEKFKNFLEMLSSLSVEEKDLVRAALGSAPVVKIGQPAVVMTPGKPQFTAHPSQAGIHPQFAPQPPILITKPKLVFPKLGNPPPPLPPPPLFTTPVMKAKPVVLFPDPVQQHINISATADPTQFNKLPAQQSSFLIFGGKKYAPVDEPEVLGESGQVGFAASTPHHNQTFVYPGNNHNTRISTFSGDDKECGYEQFKFDVAALQSQGTPEGNVILSIRRALKGVAQETLVHMGPGVSLYQIMQKFDIMFGDVNPLDVLLSKFYSASQRANESVMQWYTRLEDLAGRIRQKDPSKIPADEYQRIINTKFHAGLQNANIKNALRHVFDQDPDSIQLFVSARMVETEFANSAKAHQISTDITPSMQKQLQTVLDKLAILEENAKQSKKQEYVPQRRPNNTGFQPRLNNYQSQQSDQTGGFKGSCYRCRQFGHLKRDCPLNSTQAGVGNVLLSAKGSVPPTMR